MNLLEFTKQFKTGPIVVDINPLRSVGGKRSAPHLRTTAYHFGWLDCDWINTESSFEADFVLVTAMNPGVSAIYHQRARLSLPNGSTYTPDFLVLLDGRLKIVEVKPYKFTLEPKWVETFALAQEICHSAGIEYEIATEQQFRLSKIHKRAEYIAYCSGLKFKTEDIELAINYVSAYPNGVTLGQFSQDTNLTKLIVLHLAAWRKLSLNAALEHEENSIVWPGKAI